MFPLINGIGELKYLNSTGDGTIDNPNSFSHYDILLDKLNSGKLYTCNHQITLANLTSFKLLFKTSSIKNVILYNIKIETIKNPILFNIIEDQIILNNGTNLPILNKNRNLNNFPISQIFYNPIIELQGSLIDYSIITSSNNFLYPLDSFILKSNSNYIFEIDNQSGNTSKIFIKIVFGEE